MELGDRFQTLHSELYIFNSASFDAINTTVNHEIP